jgi:hypothetical protein
MNKKTASVLAVLIILVFIAYMVYDTISPDVEKPSDKSGKAIPEHQDLWVVWKTLDPASGSLKAVTVSKEGSVFVGGDSWVGCYNNELNLVWNLITPKPVTSLSISGDSLFASTQETIIILSLKGEIKGEWGPFDNNTIITSVTANKAFVAFADAGNKIVCVLKKNGDMKSIIGKSNEPFIVPSPYFDVALTADNSLYIANTGNRRIEKRTIGGELLGYFGQPGTDPDAFCGCCNPAHFVVTGDGFVTAEKGINRIKVLNADGKFREFVSSENKFLASIPLDLAYADVETIYAANPADHKLYIFKRK